MLMARNRKLFQHLLVSQVWPQSPTKHVRPTVRRLELTLCNCFFVFFSAFTKFPFAALGNLHSGAFLNWVWFPMNEAAASQTLSTRSLSCIISHNHSLSVWLPRETWQLSDDSQGPGDKKKEKKKREKKNSLFRQRIETPDSPWGLFVHKNSKV